jgi:hypothetical protein
MKFRALDCIVKVLQVSDEAFQQARTQQWDAPGMQGEARRHQAPYPEGCDRQVLP